MTDEYDSSQYLSIPIVERLEGLGIASADEAATTLRTLRAKVKAMHAGLPYFNVPHIREGLEDMLDVIGKIEKGQDQ